MNNYNSVDTSTLIGISVAYLAFFIIFYVWMALALSKVFTKLGEQGFKGWVPIVNTITIFRLGGVNPLWILIFLAGPAAVVGSVMMIIAINNINKRFGLGVGMTVLAVFLAPVWASILGFGSAVPIGGVPRPAVETPPAPFGAPAPAVAPAAWSPAPPAPPAVIVPPAPPAVIVPPVVSAPPAAVSTPVASANPWAPPITGVPGLDLSKPAVVPPLVETLAALVTNSVNTSAQVAELQATVEDENPDFDKTVVVPRKKKETWVIVPEGGVPITLTKSAALLGRNPSSTAADTQLVSVPDPVKTVSKTHARLTLVDGVWTIVDLNSTNGVYLLSDGNDETEVEAGVPTPIGEAFRLGDLTIRISKAG